MKVVSVLVFFFLTVTAAFSETDSVLANVGGVPVTKYEVARKFQKVLPLSGTFHGGVGNERRAEIWQDSLNEVIDQAFKVRYAMDAEISVPRERVDAQVDELVKKAGSEKNLVKMLGGESVVEYRASLYRQLLAEAAQKVAVDEKVKLSEDKFKEYFDKNASHFPRPKMYRASHIMIKVSPVLSKEEKDVLYNKAFDLYKRAKAGEDFYDLAYYNSDDQSKYVGGDLNYFPEGKADAAFDKALSEMKIGDIVGPVQTLYGYHVIKLTDVQPARLYTYEEARPLIQSTLVDQLRRETESQWIDSLKTKYVLEKY